MNNQMNEFSGDINDIEYIFSPLTIRKKSHEIFNLALAGQTNFYIHSEKLEEVAKFVSSITLENYPDLNIPFHSRWNHFNVGNIDRIKELKTALERFTPNQRTKSKLDLVVLSVLLDAGAGIRWRYLEKRQEKNTPDQKD